MFMAVIDFDSTATVLEARMLVEAASVRAHLPQIREALASLEEIVRRNPAAAWARYHLGYAHHRLGALMHAQKKGAAGHLAAAAEELKQAARLLPASAEPRALLSTCYGMQIRYAPLKAFWLGEWKARTMAEAERLERENPRVIFLRALQRWSTPRLAGGDRDEALAGFERAVERFDSWTETEPLGPRWGHVQALAYHGMALLEMGDEERARDALRSALRMEPGYHWVRQVLLPKAGGVAG